MTDEALQLSRTIVFAFGLLYWGGVWVQARRIRKRIGRSPNVRPRGVKEKLLWVGWSSVVLAWLVLPFLSRNPAPAGVLVILPALVSPFSAVVGVLMMVVGYGGTLWCYVAMGSAWRMGVNKGEQILLVTNGPYRYVRHPIYTFQIFMVAAISFLLPSALSLAMLIVHVVCVLAKASDEESHLRSALGPSYAAYCARTGRWLPRLRGRTAS